MKRIFLVALLATATLVASTGCSSVESNLPDIPAVQSDLKKLPASAQEFVLSHFRDYKASQVWVAPVMAENGSLYSIILEPTSNATRAASVVKAGVRITFDKQGQWIELEHLRDGGALPSSVLSLLPAPMLQYLARHHAGVGVHEVERKAFGYELELVNDRELLFDRHGELLHTAPIGGNTPEVAPMVGSVSSFMQKHFPGYKVVYTKTEQDDGREELKVYIRKGYQESFKLVFDDQSRWLEVEGDDLGLVPVPASIVGLLPASVGSEIAKRYPQRPVTSVEVRPQGYKLELKGDVELYFDKEGKLQKVDEDSDTQQGGDTGQIIQGLPQQAKDFLAKHFPGVYVRKIERKAGGRTIEVELSTGVEIDFDSEGRWMEIDGDDRPLPKSVVALLPAKLIQHLHASYPGSAVLAMERNGRGYKIELLYRGGDLDLLYDAEGNYLGQED